MGIWDVNEFTDPFGQADCEAELKSLDMNGYKDIFFEQTPFNDSAIRKESYLIIGRRGSGKTALANYFSFHKSFENALCIDVDEPARYKQVLDKISNLSGIGGNDSTLLAEQMWTCLIWCIIFRRTREYSDAISKACVPCADDKSNSGYLYRLVNYFVDSLAASEQYEKNTFASDHMDSLEFNNAIKSVKNFAKKKKIVIAIDTLEKYNTSDYSLMSAVAGLIQAAAKFNNENVHDGIHIKVFVSGEIFPYLTEGPLSNTLKSVKHPVYMGWRARDLLRLIAWRYYKFLKKNDLLDEKGVKDINWDDPQEVRRKIWSKYFGNELINDNNHKEDTFSYVLRHTQMRPRQLIVLCNRIAGLSIRSESFPFFSNEDIVAGVRSGEEDLASEVFNSYSEVYPNASEIARALDGLPIVFSGKEIDKRAPESARYWKHSEYSPASFSKLLVELGIVGKVVRESADGHYDVEFQYAQKSRVFISHRHKCAIHPMFFSTLGIDKPCSPIIIHPEQFKREEPWLYEK